MGGTQWVQHISGQGEKWELDGASPREYDRGIDWCVKAKSEGQKHWLPKSEYVICEPPERWVDVSQECTVVEEHDRSQRLRHDGKTIFATAWEGLRYKIRKVQIEREYPQDKQCAFIVEKKVP